MKIKYGGDLGDVDVEAFFADMLSDYCGTHGIIPMLESIKYDLEHGRDPREGLGYAWSGLTIIYDYYRAETDAEKEKIFRERSGI